MKIVEVDAATIAAAVDGDLGSIDRLLVAIQPGVFNLAVRMLGNRDDASDAAQEILLKVITHLAGFRGEARFSTWVYSVARRHLLTASTKSRESPEVSLDGLAERLEAGLDYGAGHPAALTPEDKLEARQVAVGCTQTMLMTLDREERLTYLLDAVFGLSSTEGGEVLGITAEAFRKRLSRVRQTIEPFLQRTCGLVEARARCRCDRQLPALRAIGGVPDVPPAVAEAHLDAVLRMSDAAAVFRAHPEYRAASAMIPMIRHVLQAAGYWESRSRQ